jgi:hypothetical protein
MQVAMRQILQLLPPLIFNSALIALVPGCPGIWQDIHTEAKSLMSVRQPDASRCVEGHRVDEGVQEGCAIDDAGGQDQEPDAFGKVEVETSGGLMCGSPAQSILCERPNTLIARQGG